MRRRLRDITESGWTHDEQPFDSDHTIDSSGHPRNVLGRLARLTTLCIVVAFGCGCGNEKHVSPTSTEKATGEAQDEKPSSKRPDFGIVLSDGERASADAMLAVLSEHRPLLEDQEKQVHNFRPLLYLAATSPDAFVVNQSLSMLAEALPVSEEPSAGSPLSRSAALREAKPVLLHFLGEGDSSVVFGALDLARHYVGREVDVDVLARLDALLSESSSSVVAGASAEALGNVPLFRLSSRAKKSIEKILLSPSTQPVSAGHILMLLINARGAAGYQTGVERWTRAEEPVVRALAVRALAQLGSPTRSRLQELLEDSEPVVRSAAAQALGEVGDEAAIGALVGLLDDDAATDVPTLVGKGPEGARSRLQLLNPIRSRVSISVMLSLERLSGGQLKLVPFLPSETARLIPQNRETTRTWLRTRAVN